MRYRPCLVGYTVIVIGLFAGCSGSGGISTPPSQPLITEYTNGIDNELTALTAGPDGNIWYATDNPIIGRITLAGQVTELQDQPTCCGSATRDIVVGSGGDLWFTSADYVGRMSPNGAYTDFVIPFNVGPNGICEGPDGNEWFTEQNTGSIGRITPTGSITTFAAPVNSAPAYIVNGPDGSLWFTEPGIDSIARITPSGIITQFPVGISPHGGLLPGLGHLAFGPDGQIWFPDSNNNTIRTMSTSGVLGEYYAGISLNAGLNSIARGPDGNMWFTESELVNQSGADKIGRISPTGAVKEFKLPGSPGDITVGPDGNIWFTQILPVAVGRIRIQ
jgi:streptogramin lyase